MNTLNYNVKDIMKKVFLIISQPPNLEQVYQYFIDEECCEDIPDWIKKEIDSAVYDGTHLIIQTVKYDRIYPVKMSLSKALRRWGAKDLDFLSKIVEKYKRLAPHVEYQVVEGEDIIRYYAKSSDNNYDETYSCMKYNPSDCLRFYDDNFVKLAIGLDEYGNLVSKCLLWDIGGEIYVDRIYEKAGDILSYIKSEYDVAGTYPEDKHLLDGYKLYHVAYDYYQDNILCPYLDTADYIGKKGDTYYLNIGDFDDRYDMVFDVKNTYGWAPGLTACSNCGSFCHTEDLRYYDFIECEICPSCQEEVVYVESIDDYRWEDDCFFCNEDGQYYEMSDVVTTVDGIKLPIQYTIEFDGNYFREDDLYICDMCGGYIKPKYDDEHYSWNYDTGHMKDDLCYCEDCYERESDTIIICI